MIIGVTLLSTTISAYFYYSKYDERAYQTVSIYLQIASMTLAGAILFSTLVNCFLISVVKRYVRRGEYQKEQIMFSTKRKVHRNSLSNVYADSGSVDYGSDCSSSLASSFTSLDCTEDGDEFVINF